MEKNEVTIEEITEATEVITEEETIMTNTENMTEATEINETEAQDITPETTETKSDDKLSAIIGIGLVTLPVALIGFKVAGKIKKIKEAKSAAKLTEVTEENPTEVNEDDEAKEWEKLIKAYREALSNANAKIKNLEQELKDLTESDAEVEND